MNFNKKLFDKIDNIIKISKDFDENYKKVINIEYKNITDDIIECIYALTKYYISLRSEHGNLILMMDEFKNSIDMKDNNDNKINQLYDLSTFNSILTNINELITNIDFQYKKFAIKYPKFINKKPMTILLLTESDDESNEYVNLINQVKKQLPENIYKIVKCNKSEKKFKCNKILDINLTLKITELPMLFIINGTNIVEVPIDKFKDVNTLTNIIN